MYQSSGLPHNLSSDNPIFHDLLEHAIHDDRILAVLVFGSYTTQINFRDIDICLIMRDNIEKSRVLLEYIKLYGDPLDIQEFSLLPLFIRTRVMKEGKFLMNKDFDQVCQLYLQTIQDYNLFEPHFKTFLDAVEHG